MDALRQIDGWPAAHASAGATTATGTLATAGDAERTYELASVSKLLVAYAALVAAEEGAIDLDGPAGPEGSTFRHLLSHASGLGPDGDRLAPPERSRIYSNGGYNLLADELARHADMPFERYLHESVVAPLGLSAELRGDPGAGIAASLADMLAFGRELLEPRLVARETLDEATSVQFPGLVGVLPGYGRMEPNDWGLGFELKDAKRPHWTGGANSEPTFGHFGSKAGTATFLWVDRSAGVACAALADESFGDWAREAWPRLSDAVLAEASAEA